MKGITVITTVIVLASATVASRAGNVDRISAQTGVPVATLQAERTSTGLGWGELENAHLLASALAAKGSDLTFNNLLAMHQAGEGWGEIAHDNGLNLGKIVSAAHRSSHATMHAKNTKTMHGKSATSVHGKSATKTGASHTGKMSSAHSFGHGSRFGSGFGGFHGGMHSMGHMGGGHR